jgi:hypothetical protein
MVISTDYLVNPIWSTLLELVTPILIISTVLIIIAIHRHISSFHQRKDK